MSGSSIVYEITPPFGDAPEDVEIDIQVAIPYSPGYYGYEVVSPEPFIIRQGEDVVVTELDNGSVVGSATLYDVGAMNSEPVPGIYLTSGYTNIITVTGEFDAFPCFATGTLIATSTGLVAVEDLTLWHAACLAAGGTARITWIGHRRQIDGEVIRIRAHALGDHTPSRDLIVSADHGMFLDGVLVQAGLLVSGETIVRERCDEVVFWHVELEHHGILLAENAPAESYLDTGNRRQFGNCPLAYDPARVTQDRCAEVVFGGERLDRIRARLPVPA